MNFHIGWWCRINEIHPPLFLMHLKTELVSLLLLLMVEREREVRRSLGGGELDENPQDQRVRREFLKKLLTQSGACRFCNYL
jgi:hypothetical protein